MLEPADLDEIRKVFNFYDVTAEGNADVLYGVPLAEANLLYGALYTYFSPKKKEAVLQRRHGEVALVVRETKADNIWINVALAVATLISTTLVGALLSGVDIFRDPQFLYLGLPFALAIMLVLGSHEFGHYLVSRKNGVDATLPYFIPFPIPPIGTMGAVIRQKGPIPSRKALFDVGISGPLVGLTVAVIVTVIGLMLPAPAITAQPGDLQIQTPLLFNLIADIVRPGISLQSINPIAFAGWVGMLVTVLNLLPVGQLDGGHVARAVLGRWSDKLSKVLPLLIIFFGFFSTYFMGMSGEMWVIWGFVTYIMSIGQHPAPLDEMNPDRMALLEYLKTY